MRQGFASVGLDLAFLENTDILFITDTFCIHFIFRNIVLTCYLVTRFFWCPSEILQPSKYLAH